MNETRARSSTSAAFQGRRNTVFFAKYHHAPKDTMSPAWPANLTVQMGQTETHDLGCVACVAGRKRPISGHPPKLLSILLSARKIVTWAGFGERSNSLSSTWSRVSDEMAPVDGNLLRNAPPPSASRVLPLVTIQQFRSKKENNGQSAL